MIVHRQSFGNFSLAMHERIRVAYHSTAWAPSSNATLIVVHENRAIEGYPNVLSREPLTHVFVLGSRETPGQFRFGTGRITEITT